MRAEREEQDLMTGLGPRVRELLVSAGLPHSDPVLTRLKGGRNNRVYGVEVAGSRYLLKEYFRHPGDPRDRLGAEYSFSSFAAEMGVKMAPAPIARDTTHGLGLFEFVQGRKLTPGEIDTHLVQQAARFFCELNEHRNTGAAKLLPNSAEACFSLEEHFLTLEKRISRLDAISGGDDLDQRARDLAKGPLKSAWNLILEQKGKMAGSVDIGAMIHKDDRCLSPSDFGFHNALIQPDGRVRFFDFEYAGWDDPAKMLCDFFLQPQIPVSHVFFPIMWESAERFSTDPEFLRKRVSLLRKVYQLKWCCIMLNDFIPVDRERRMFVENSRIMVRKNQQIYMARQLLEKRMDWY